jgi:hypothetical protein
MRWVERAGRRALVTVGTAAGTLLMFAIWLTVMLWPRLVVESEPMVDGFWAFAVQPRVGIYDGFGRRKTGYIGEISVQSPNAPIAGDTIRPAVAGRVQFEELALMTNSPDVRSEDGRLFLRFRGTGQVRGVATEVRGSAAQVPNTGSLDDFSVVKLRINGREVGLRETHRLPIKDSVTVTLTYQFTTFAATANYIVGAASTWEPRETSAIRLAGLPRPVSHVWQTRTVTLKAPDEPGLHHLLVVMQAEDHVDHIFSATNWTLGAPIWNNGDDLIDLPIASKRELRDTFSTSASKLQGWLNRRQADEVFGSTRQMSVLPDSVFATKGRISGYAVEFEFFAPP